MNYKENLLKLLNVVCEKTDLDDSVKSVIQDHPYMFYSGAVDLSESEEDRNTFISYMIYGIKHVHAYKNVCCYIAALIKANYAPEADLKNQLFQLVHNNIHVEPGFTKRIEPYKRVYPRLVSLTPTESSYAFIEMKNSKLYIEKTGDYYAVVIDFARANKKLVDWDSKMRALVESTVASV